MPRLRAANCNDLLAPFADRICRVCRERDARRRVCRSCSRRAGNSLQMAPAAAMVRRPCRGADNDGGRTGCERGFCRSSHPCLSRRQARAPVGAGFDHAAASRLRPTVQASELARWSAAPMGLGTAGKTGSPAGGLSSGDASSIPRLQAACGACRGATCQVTVGGAMTSCMTRLSEPAKQGGLW